MQTQQINLKLPINLLKLAETYAKNNGFQNIQELTRDCLRKEVTPKIKYDNSFTKKEIRLIDTFVSKIMGKEDFVSEKELFKNLSRK